MHITTAFKPSFMLAGLVASFSVNAAILNLDDTLTINTGIPTFDVFGDQIEITQGSWFAINLNGNARVDGFEKVALSQGTDGIVVGMTTSPGAYHAGLVLPSDSNAVTAPWVFFGNTGSDYIVVPISGGTQGVDMSGWRAAWLTISDLSLGSGAWGSGFLDGIGNFAWNGQDGAAYTLDYRATIPQSDPNGFGGLQYALHLEGIVQRASIPEPTTIALIGAGLLGIRLSQRRKQD